jgi:hypothetical protein
MMDVFIFSFRSGVQYLAHNHACLQYIFRWILLKRPHVSWT